MLCPKSYFSNVGMSTISSQMTHRLFDEGQDDATREYLLLLTNSRVLADRIEGNRRCVRETRKKIDTMNNLERDPATTAVLEYYSELVNERRKLIRDDQTLLMDLQSTIENIQSGAHFFQQQNKKLRMM
mmetsp:Transcript_40439/g.95012  ORF Transcript_40439/g.95012 Transcript_40439/m.95012 type:complete len:129 (-) Transcript_40439:540-926(-)